MSKKERAGYHFKGEVRSMPKKFTNWVDRNAERIKSAKSLPYFIKDNYVGGNIERGLRINYDTEYGSLRSNLGLSYSIDKNDELCSYTADISKVRDNALKTAQSLGIELKEPMTFYEADNAHANPKYNWYNNIFNDNAYRKNCVITADVFELRLRGIDVSAVGVDKNHPLATRYYKQGELSSIWIDPKTKQRAKVEFVRGHSLDKLEKAMSNTMASAGRYKVGVRMKGGMGHAFTAINDGTGTIRYYDAQSNELDYSDWKNDIDLNKDVQIVRIDDKIIDINTVRQIASF